jgi:molybdenum cofactor guanylyltransferase
MRIAVVVLAGGAGSRIGGGKPLKLLGGKRLIDRAEALARQWSDILAVAVREPEQTGSTTLTRILDEPGIEGPLAGLAAALRFARDAGCQAVLTIPADMPFLPTDLGSRLIDGLANASAALASSGGHLHPVCGNWQVSALEDIADYLASERRSLRGFAEAIGFQTVEWRNEPLDPFFNINSEQDLTVAERLLGT